MLAPAEGQVVIRCPSQVKAVRIIEYRFIAIGGRKPERNAVSRVNLLAAQLGIHGRDASEVSYRTGPAKNFFHRCRHDFRVFEQALHLLRVLKQGQQSGRDGVARGLQARAHVEQPIVGELRPGEQTAVDGRVAQNSKQVLAVPAAPFERGVETVLTDIARALLPGVYR